MSRNALIALVLALVAGAAALAVLAGGGGEDDGGAIPRRTAPERTDAERRPTNDQQRERPKRERPERPMPDPNPRGLVVGIGDQKAETFDDPLFVRELHVRRSRLNAPWNAVFTERDRLDAWLNAARREGVEPVVAFERARGSSCPADPCALPSKAEYEDAFRAFRRRYPWVRIVQPWNEANSGTQPTGKAPAQAAAFYEIVRRHCRRCRVPAADVLDSANMQRWVRRFLAALKGPTPRLWGLHNYSDTNRFRDRGTSAFLRLVPGEVWVTESGGIVSFTTAAGRAVFPPDERRAARAVRYMFRLALKHNSRIKRVYVYQWRLDFQGNRFDAGLVAPDGKPRPALAVVREYLRLFR